LISPGAGVEVVVGMGVVVDVASVVIVPVRVIAACPRLAYEVQ
jgi:hypothetical protein